MKEDQLPREWIDRGYRLGSGELAWQRQDALAVVNAFLDLDFAVFGGELLVEEDKGHVWGGFPAFDDRLGGLYVWDIKPGWLPATETWRQFCERAAEHNRSVIRAFEDEWVRPDLRPHVRFCLTLISRENYERLSTSRDP